MKRVLSVIGTRPEAVKLSPVIHELSLKSEIESIVCVTAQHRQMLDQVLRIFNIKPDYDLDLMTPGLSHGGLTAKVFEFLEPVYTEVKPDWVIVQGDTTTVLVASLLAYYLKLKLGHVEAGLRTGDKFQPFPEEVNRIVASVVADLHFAPTELSRQNLLRENIPDSKIVVTGNPGIDALNWVIKQPFDISSLDIGLLPENTRLVLVTTHRRESFGKPLENICMAIKELAELYDGQVHFAYPVHLNPAVQKTTNQILQGIRNVSLLPPLDYQTMINLMKQSFIILTDSGGIQEEAAGLGVPTLVMRKVTERPEGIQAGTLKLVGTNKEVIVNETQHLLENASAYNLMANAVNPFGDGLASRRIVDALLSYQER